MIYGFFPLFLLLLLYKIIPGKNIVFLPIVVLINFIFNYSISLLLSHFGVYIKDLSNLLVHLLRLWWYLSPGIYSLNRIPKEYQIYWKLNPLTTIFESYRDILLYNKFPHMKDLVVILVFSLILMSYSLKKLYIEDQNYTKVV